ncbi:vitamin-D-receptor interacting mediator subunit 4-domain-containing protein [Sordaria brevicollis]|uniref:Mediator of RNA polymerase II transcription subunit 4 n=1 Tax=Sordaria brevicollis TaxID=83679 RepID=A0AAE0PEL7_SORBR|nr:vitamin-D-receptor interacting mediator subunit 4-domain-containing protein [Sordaria brevicollis]
MDKYLDARFERVEKALATFIDSIAKYNPSEKLAEDLVAADRELALSLKELERHQNNHARIMQLRQETVALDQQTKDIIGGLWNMRKEVKTTPATQYPATGPKYKFTTHELLNYAKRISRTTLPPTHLIVESNNLDAQQQLQNQGGGGGQPMDLDSAAPTPMPGTTTAAGTPAASAAPTPAPSGPSGPSTAAAAPFSQQPPPPPSANQTALPHDLKTHIDPLAGFQFHPWPTEDKVRMGGMAAYQSLISRAMDPKGYDPEEEERRKKEEEEARKEAEERAIREREEEEKRMREERERMARERERARREEAERSGSISGPSAGAGPGAVSSSGSGGGRSQFTFLDGMDDDDDDDDD